MRNKSSESYKIKAIDKKILGLIQNDDLCTPQVTKIAHRTGLPTSTVHSKLNRMKAAGIIKEYSATLDARTLERDFVAFILGQISFSKEKDFDSAGEELKRIPQVEEVYFITGEWDYLAKVRVKDKEEYYEVMQKIAKCFGVRAKGMISPKCFKDTHKIML
ncbi:Lrp/AsnC family transcriptional regulator [Candidatus Woesearchaeota archaeon]|nr:Lrp/AsnC family transcriptional regulator [Candidatus Woesearchaeota archaeon]